VAPAAASGKKSFDNLNKCAKVIVMKLINATLDHPLFTVVYQYVRGNTYSFTHYFEVTGDKKKTTMEATDNETLAKGCADYLLTQPGIAAAIVTKHTGLTREIIYTRQNKNLTR
jgi:hypothetical protein